VGFIFGGLAISSFVFAYFCVPEMKGRSLEEINQMFQDGVPVRQFRTYNAADSTALNKANRTSLDEITPGVQLTRLEGQHRP
jgi:hypothetical protein